MDSMRKKLDVLQSYPSGHVYIFGFKKPVGYIATTCTSTILRICPPIRNLTTPWK